MKPFFKSVSIKSSKKKRRNYCFRCTRPGIFGEVSWLSVFECLHLPIHGNTVQALFELVGWTTTTRRWNLSQCDTLWVLLFKSRCLCNSVLQHISRKQVSEKWCLIFLFLILCDLPSFCCDTDLYFFPFILFLLSILWIVLSERLQF